MKQLIELLEELAKKKTLYDREDYDPQDFSGGNFDDAYSRGCDDGEVALARELLNRFFSKEEKQDDAYSRGCDDGYANALYHGVQVICEIFSFVSPEEQEIEELLDIIRGELKKKNTGKEVKRNNTDTLENRIEATWNEYQFLQDEYRKMTGREYMWRGSVEET